MRDGQPWMITWQNRCLEKVRQHRILGGRFGSRLGCCSGSGRTHRGLERWKVLMRKSDRSEQIKKVKGDICWQ